MKLAISVSLYPTLSRKRARGQTNRYASFTLTKPNCATACSAFSGNACFTVIPIRSCSACIRRCAMTTRKSKRLPAISRIFRSRASDTSPKKNQRPRRSTRPHDLHKGWARFCAHAATNPRGQTIKLSAHPCYFENKFTLVSRFTFLFFRMACVH